MYMCIILMIITNSSECSLRVEASWNYERRLFFLIWRTKLKKEFAKLVYV